MTISIGRAVVAVALLCLPLVEGRAAIVDVAASSNLFAAGRASTAGFDPGGGGPGTLPVLVVNTSPTGAAFRFNSVTGLVNCCANNTIDTTGPDGAAIPLIYQPNTDINSFAGIAGLQFTNRQMFLAGVFLNDSVPSDPAPTRLTYSSTGDTSPVYYPGLNQTFFIGDGLTGTGSGSIQVFYSPFGATRLFLGFVDAWGFFGDPGYYDDNTGFFTVDVDIQNPEPATFVLFGLGLTGLAMWRRAKRA